MKTSREDLNDVNKRSKNVITVVGCGRRGLTTACILAEAGFNVICLDVNQYVVERIQKAIVPFDEPELKEILPKIVKAKLLRATSNFEDAIPYSDTIFVMVPAILDERGRPDYSLLERACRNIGLILHPGTLIIVGSPLSPGTTESLLKETLETASGLKAGKDFGLAYSPAWILRGATINELKENPIVLGAIDEDSYRRAEEILTTFSKDKIIKVRNMRTAETVTLLKIIYQDVKKALANEISELCEKMRIDFMEVMHSANAQLKSQIPPPGIVEEHYSKDPYLLISEAESLRVKLRVVSASRKVNETVYKRVLKLLRDAIRSCGKTASRARVLILGLSSIPNLKNIEGSPVRQLISTLQRKGMSIRVYDPLFSYKELLEMGYETERSLLQAARDTDCIIIAVGHDRFKRLSLKRLKMVMRKPAAIVDLDHVLNYKEAEREGFIYRGLGRGVWSR